MGGETAEADEVDVMDPADGAHLVPELLLPHAEEAPPSFSEKFLVALLSSLYLNATRLPPSAAACMNLMLLCLLLNILTNTDTMAHKTRIDATEAVETKIVVQLRSFEDMSMADNRR